MQSTSKLNKADYEKLYQYVLEVNDENIEGAFYVETVDELKEKAYEYVMNNVNGMTYSLREDLLSEIDDLIEEGYSHEEAIQHVKENFIDDLRWQGEGMYHFWGLGFIKEVTIANTVEIFEAETEGFDYQVFLGNSQAIEKMKKELFGYDEDKEEYIYLIFYVNHGRPYDPLEYITDIRSEKPLKEYEVFEKYANIADLYGGAETDSNGNVVNHVCIEAREINDINLLLKVHQGNLRYWYY